MDSGLLMGLMRDMGGITINGMGEIFFINAMGGVLIAYRLKFSVTFNCPLWAALV